MACLNKLPLKAEQTADKQGGTHVGGDQSCGAEVGVRRVQRLPQAQGTTEAAPDAQGNEQDAKHDRHDRHEPTPPDRLRSRITFAVIVAAIRSLGHMPARMVRPTCIESAAVLNSHLYGRQRPHKPLRCS